MRKFLILLASVFVLSVLWGAAGCFDPRPQTTVKTVYYSEYGAKGDGETDDFNAIITAHEHANRNGYKVKADKDAVYYIGASNKTAIIKTDTDWGNAQFIIDDSQFVAEDNVWQDAWVFKVASKYEKYEYYGIETLQKNQSKINISLQRPAVITVTDNTTKRFIRRGQNQNSGSNQTDVFIVDKSGNVDKDTPILWDFDNISELIVRPIDETTLTIKGGVFTTVANTGNADNNYMKRGICITRSNTIVDGITHDIKGEGDQGAPYDAFIKTENCAYITIQNCTLRGHRAYKRPSDSSITRGTYDINCNRTIHVLVQNCDQTNDIKNNYWWGIFTSNFCKNITLDNVKFSRFDAHQGVHNATILNSELGWQAISIIGSGTLNVENTTVYGNNFIYLRNDYGSTWNGDFYFKDCVFNPINLSSGTIIYTNNDGKWDFGYPCYMPRIITIDGFKVKDENAPAGYNGVLLFYAVNNGSNEPYPYALTEVVSLSGYESIKNYRMPNSYITQHIPVVIE